MILVACLTSTGLRAELSGEDDLGGGRVDSKRPTGSQASLAHETVLSRSPNGATGAMIPMKPTAVAFVLTWSLIPLLADSESTSPGVLDTETATRDQPNRGRDDPAPGLGQAESANGNGQAPEPESESADPSRSDQRRGETPSLGLCDGS
ncbi:hypothetical protein [Thiocapsa rosea]|nr:hypothetical protein [Thiocapsa rosea]